MFEQQPKSIQQKVISFAANSIKRQEPSGWFEPLYAEAKGNTAQVPWAKNQAPPYLQQWGNKLKLNNIALNIALAM